MREPVWFWQVAPQEPGAVWQVDLFLLPLWMKPEEEGEPRLEMVWSAFCLDLRTSEIAVSRMAGAPEASLAAEVLPLLVLRTRTWPERIQTADLEVAAKVRAALESGDLVQAPIEVEVREDVFELRTVFEAYREQISLKGPGYATVLYNSAEALHDSGQHEGAVAALRELLRRDRYDFLKARYLLADSLLHLRRHDELQELFSRYRDASAFWSWPRALLAFRLQGDSPAAREILSRAFHRNPFVPRELLRKRDRRLPSVWPRLLQTGSEDEAIAYAGEGRAAWRATPGALEWLQARTKEKGRKKK
jgi:tetratricopeptide (TPR) repeat protein